jgi:hypothetical protein
LSVVKNDPYNFGYLPFKFRNDKDIAYTAIQLNPNEFEYASDNIHNNKEIALMAIKHNEFLIIDTSEKLRNDIEFNIDCIINNKNYFNKIINKNSSLKLEDQIFKESYNLFELIHNLEHNFNINNIVLNKLFLKNINYISKITKFYDIFKYLIINQKFNFINNLKYFINIINNNQKYIFTTPSIIEYPYNLIGN